MLHAILDLCSRGCLGCHNKPKPITSVDAPPKELSNQRRTVKKPIISEDFWTSSTLDMENSAVMSQGSISSISTSNQTLDPNNGAGSASIPSEFQVTHYMVLFELQVSCPNSLLLWNQTRQRWVGNRRSDNCVQQIREPKLSWNATYESLLGSNKPFPQPIPLAEMVDFLVDIWEQDGMYD
ncbi:hypothetical protein FNV43_RR06970 [Rhamnella rubrinervis]|uniref:Gag1-like clamp domain-containing protein n=1 Tax=Rhamnella rubrinervis TaxID=2594499 RepID=A0A8K0HED8_9ROSA|nr:hypothetical protein FNV43_RR06970 [Rhamnella rubrinervis]